MYKTRLLILLSILNFSLVAAQTKTSPDKQIEDILKKLTLEEKAGQLNLIPIPDEPTAKHLQLIREGKVGSILKANGVSLNRKLQKIAVEESPSGLPILFQEDVIHGYKTIAPVPLAESASWDMDAIRKSAAVAAREATASGVQLTYAPMVDICRDPRWGRIIEAAGEDPYLGSQVAAARVKGFQESGDEHQNILSCVKHFAGYGASLAGRDYNIQDFSERELREIFLPPFQAAVDADVASLMCAYSAYDGVPLCANDFLLKDVLRDEMGFKGLVMTDWATINNLIKTGIAKDDDDATEMSIKAGIDMDMSSYKFVELLPKLVREGKVSEELVDNAVRNVLRLKQRAGLLDDPYRYFDDKREQDEILSKRNLKETKDIALKSMVLLKNDENILPINNTIKEIAIIGPFAKSQIDLLGWWSCKGEAKDVVSIYDGLETEFGNNVKFSYAQGCAIDSFRPAGAELIPQAVETAQKADLVIMVLGEEYWMSGEGGGVASLTLPGLQEQLLEEIAKTGKPIVTVVTAGRPYVLSNIEKYSKAILYAWMPGTTGGTAVAEILSGKFNPQGKLPVTFPRHQGQIPIFYSYRRTSHLFLPGIASNRYSTTHRDIPTEPLYPFGYGLSYTTYNYSEISLNKAELDLNGNIEAKVEVTNTGTQKGTEIVQLYIGDQVCSVTRPVKELKDFSLVELEPGETKTVSFVISPDKLTFIGRNMKKTIEAGNFDLFIGTNSTDCKKTNFSLKE